MKKRLGNTACGQQWCVSSSKQWQCSVLTHFDPHKLYHSSHIPGKFYTSKQDTYVPVWTHSKFLREWNWLEDETHNWEAVDTDVTDLASFSTGYLESCQQWPSPQQSRSWRTTRWPGNTSLSFTALRKWLLVFSPAQFVSWTWLMENQVFTFSPWGKLGIFRVIYTVEPWHLGTSLIIQLTFHQYCPRKL